MLNTVALMGRLTADAELKTTQSGIAVCAFTIACDRSYAKA
ncbi:MAG: single-stranded DNA-binding protein, partial [Christensenella sp.]